MIPYFECSGRGHCSPIRNCKWWDFVECDQQSTFIALMAASRCFFYQSVDFVAKMVKFSLGVFSLPHEQRRISMNFLCGRKKKTAIYSYLLQGVFRAPRKNRFGWIQSPNRIEVTQWLLLWRSLE